MIPEELLYDVGAYNISNNFSSFDVLLEKLCGFMITPLDLMAQESEDTR